MTPLQRIIGWIALPLEAITTGRHGTLRGLGVLILWALAACTASSAASIIVGWRNAWWVGFIAVALINVLMSMVASATVRYCVRPRRSGRL